MDATQRRGREEAMQVSTLSQEEKDVSEARCLGVCGSDGCCSYPNTNRGELSPSFVFAWHHHAQHQDVGNY